MRGLEYWNIIPLEKKNDVSEAKIIPSQLQQNTNYAHRDLKTYV